MLSSQHKQYSVTTRAIFRSFFMGVGDCCGVVVFLWVLGPLVVCKQAGPQTSLVLLPYVCAPSAWSVGTLPRRQARVPFLVVNSVGTVTDVLLACRAAL